MIKFLTRRRNLLGLLAMSAAINLATLAFNLYNVGTYRAVPLLLMLSLSVANVAAAIACAWGWTMVYRIKESA